MGRMRYNLLVFPVFFASSLRSCRCLSKSRSRSHYSAQRRHRDNLPYRGTRVGNSDMVEMIYEGNSRERHVYSDTKIAGGKVNDYLDWRGGGSHHHGNHKSSSYFNGSMDSYDNTYEDTYDDDDDDDGHYDPLFVLSDMDTMEERIISKLERLDSLSTLSSSLSSASSSATAAHNSRHYPHRDDKKGKNVDLSFSNEQQLGESSSHLRWRDDQSQSVFPTQKPSDRPRRPRDRYHRPPESQRNSSTPTQRKQQQTQQHTNRARLTRRKTGKVPPQKDPKSTLDGMVVDTSASDNKTVVMMARRKRKSVKKGSASSPSLSTAGLHLRSRNDPYPPEKMPSTGAALTSSAKQSIAKIRRPPLSTSSPAGMVTSQISPWVKRFLASCHKDILLPVPRDYCADNFNLAHLAPIVEHIAQQEINGGEDSDAEGGLGNNRMPTEKAILSANDGGGIEALSPSKSTASASAAAICVESSPAAITKNHPERAQTKVHTTPKVHAYPLYRAALKLLLQEEPLPEHVSPLLEHATVTLYLFIHQRYITSPRGLDMVRRRFLLPSTTTATSPSASYHPSSLNQSSPNTRHDQDIWPDPIFGKCPRLSCRGMPLLPYGPSHNYYSYRPCHDSSHAEERGTHTGAANQNSLNQNINSAGNKDSNTQTSPNYASAHDYVKTNAQRYCMVCGNVWHHWDSNVNGCAWGPSFCHLFLLVFGDQIFRAWKPFRRPRLPPVGMASMASTSPPPRPQYNPQSPLFSTLARQRPTSTQQPKTDNRPVPSIFGFPLHPSVTRG